MRRTRLEQDLKKKIYAFFNPFHCYHSLTLARKPVRERERERAFLILQSFNSKKKRVRESLWRVCVSVKERERERIGA